MYNSGVVKFHLFCCIKNQHQHNKLFFIVGRGRSGTDLLQRLLNTNTEICMPPECTVLPLLYNKYNSIEKWNSKTIMMFCNDVFLDDKITNWWLIKQDELEHFLLFEKPHSFKEAICLLYKFYSFTNDSESILLGDKNPSNSLYINEILSVFEDAKIIILVRNPLDNIFSFQHVSFDSSDARVLAHRWKFYNDEILKIKEKYPQKLHFIKFENLVLNTEIELKKVAQFLEISNTFDLDKKEKGLQVWQKNLIGDISNKYLDKGIKGLNKSEIEYVNKVCSSTAIHLGYDFEISTKSEFHLFAYFFNRFEKLFIRLPLYLSSSILKYYRKKSKIIVENEN